MVIDIIGMVSPHISPAESSQIINYQSVAVRILFGNSSSCNPAMTSIQYRD